MGTTYSFNYETWVALFPEMAAISSSMANNYFLIATLLVRNDGRGPVRDPNMQAGLLNLTTAHLAKLFSRQNDNGEPDSNGAEVSSLVGRIANASEGSIKVQADLPDQQPNSAWWNQTQYGAVVWVMLRPYRTMHYMQPRHRRIYNPPMRYFGFGMGI